MGLPPLWLPRGVEWSGRERGLVVDGLKLDWCELAEDPLATPAVVGPFDPGLDGQAEFLAGDPVLGRASNYSLRDLTRMRLLSETSAFHQPSAMSKTQTAAITHPASVRIRSGRELEPFSTSTVTNSGLSS